MNENLSQHLKSLEEQYDSAPYPYVPLEKSYKNKEYNSLFVNDLTTSFYLLTQKKINRQNKIILDVGCGSGWTSLCLAEANPEAKIICVDLSASSLEVAKQRLEYHGFKDNVEFHQLALEDISQLNYKFDYINCEDVLYFCANPTESLKALKSVLKPNGIIHTNLHSYYQRFNYYRAQNLYRYLGLFDENPDEFAIEVVIETMKNLKNQVNLKQTAALKNIDSLDINDNEHKESILMNYLIQQDKGFTIPQIFAMLEESELSFLSMTNWRHWEIRDLFKNKEEIPFVWEMVLENASEEDKLHIFELLHPVHRLIDFWCFPNSYEHDTPITLPLTWNQEQWRSATIHLHPQLQCESIKEDLIKSIQKSEPWEISKYITLPTASPVHVDSYACSTILYLWEEPKRIDDLVEYWRNIKPVDLVSLNKIQDHQAWKEVTDLLIKLETFLYVLIEQE